MLLLYLLDALLPFDDLNTLYAVHHLDDIHLIDALHLVEALYLVE